MAYLITAGTEQLLPVYHALPAADSKINTFWVQKSTDYPYVTKESWQVYVQGMAHVDTPSADQYLPHRNEALDRLQLFADRLVHARDLNFDTEFQQLQDDLTLLYNKP